MENNYLILIKNRLVEYLWPIITILLIVSVFSILFWIVIEKGEANSFSDIEYWVENLLPNLIADMIGILFTTFIIAGLFSFYNSKRETKMLYSMLGKDYEQKTKKMVRNFLYILSRNEEILTPKISDNELESLLNRYNSNVKKNLYYDELRDEITLWNINEYSLVFDEFTNYIPKIEKHYRFFYTSYKNIDALRLEKEQIEFEIRLLSLNPLPNSNEVQNLKNKAKKLEDEIRFKSSLLINYPIDKRLVECTILECLDGLLKYYEDENEKFNKKYSYIIPLDMKITFKEICTHTSSIKQHIKNNNEELVYKSIVEVSTRLSKLLRYF